MRFFEGTFSVHSETQLVSRLEVTLGLCPLDDYKEFGVNCEKMASEIEDHILWGAAGPQAPSAGTHSWAQEWWWGQDGVAGTRTESDGLSCPRCLQREPRP